MGCLSCENNSDDLNDEQIEENGPLKTWTLSYKLKIISFRISLIFFKYSINVINKLVAGLYHSHHLIANLQQDYYHNCNRN